MPLRDHFRPPVSDRYTWEGFHAMWPFAIVSQLSQKLSDNYIVEPRVHLGRFFEVDIGTFDESSTDWRASSDVNDSDGGKATATWAPPKPTVVSDVDIDEEYEYSINVFQTDVVGEPNRKLVAGIELVSPGNKDRPQSRRALVEKCASLLRQDVCVSLVDLVVTMNFNLYADLLDLVGETDPMFSTPPSPIYAATVRRRHDPQRKRIESYGYPFEISKPLPSIPIWLDQSNGVTLDLEASYEETCRALRIS